jgi:hypothetical protein
MIDYLWAKEYYVGADPIEEGESDCSAEIKGCKNESKPPEYLRNIAGICYPQGLPQMNKVKFST